MSVNTRSPIVTNGLVLALDAGNTISYPRTGTTWKDLSGFNNSGTLTNGPTFDPGNGGSIVFDGTNDYVSIPYNASSFNLGTGDFTFNIWYNNNGGSDFQRLFTIGAFSTAGNFQFERGGGDRVVVHVNGDLVIFNTVNTSGNWYNFTVTRTSGIINVYKNTVNIGSSTQPGNINNTDSIQIGRDSVFGVYFNGRIPLIHLYNKSLSVQEVSQNYNATKTRFGL